MKIQIGSKGEVAWDVVLEALREEEVYETTTSGSKCSKSSIRRCSEKYFDHRLLLLLMLGVCIMSYALMYWIALQMSTYYNNGGNIIYESGGKLHHVHFSWRDCGSSDEPMKLVKLQVSPDPVHLDKNITLDLVSYQGIDIDADHPISADVKVERRLAWIWVKLPCIEGLGSCYYKDVCKVIPFPPKEPCPDPFPRFKLPCHCPISHGNYIVRNGTFNLLDILDMFPLPTWLISGDYYVKIIPSRKGKQLGCTEIYSSVKS